MSIFLTTPSELIVSSKPSLINVAAVVLPPSMGIRRCPPRSNDVIVRVDSSTIASSVGVSHAAPSAVGAGNGSAVRTCEPSSSPSRVTEGSECVSTSPALKSHKVPSGWRSKHPRPGLPPPRTNNSPLWILATPWWRVNTTAPSASISGCR
jgi:hypothetical protein